MNFYWDKKVIICEINEKCTYKGTNDKRDIIKDDLLLRAPHKI